MESESPGKNLALLSYKKLFDVFKLYFSYLQSGDYNSYLNSYLIFAMRLVKTGDMVMILEHQFYAAKEFEDM